MPKPVEDKNSKCVADWLRSVAELVESREIAVTSVRVLNVEGRKADSPARITWGPEIEFIVLSGKTSEMVEKLKYDLF